MLQVVCFSDITIPQGSVATHFRCVGTFYNSIPRNLLLTLSVELTSTWQSLKQKQSGSIFFPDTVAVYLSFLTLKFMIVTRKIS